jgi:hypothetical protein
MARRLPPVRIQDIADAIIPLRCKAFITHTDPARRRANTGLV